MVFVVDIGEENLDNIPTAAAPEPHEWAAVILVLMLGWRFQKAKKVLGARQGKQFTEMVNAGGKSFFKGVTTGKS